MLHRPLHVYDYLPPMYPEMEEEAEEAPSDAMAAEEGEAETQVSTPTSKRPRPEAGQTPGQAEDGCPLREISSVMMTAGGFLSPCREGKLPERGKVPAPDPEERRQGARRQLSDADRNSGEYGVNIKQEPGTGIIPSLDIKQEAPDDMQDYDQMITPQEIHGRGSSKDVKPKYTTGENIEKIMNAVIERGVRETSRHGGSAAPDYSDGDADIEMGEPGKPVIVKKEDNKRGSRKRTSAAAARRQESPDLFSAPQHFTANAKTPPKQKLNRIPKITEKVTLPSASSLMSGIQNPPVNPLQNPLIPQNPFGMNLYGFGNIPANLIPGFNPGLMNAMAMMQQAATAQAAANTSRDSDSAVTLDDELEEGEISPPDTPDVPVKVKKEVEEEAKRKEEEKKKEEERLRKEEKDREAEIARKKEKERIEREQEKQRQEERKKLLLLSQERDRLKKMEEEKEKEKRDKPDKEKSRDSEKEKKKSKKEKKDKDRDKSKKDKKKEKKEKKKMKEKERNKPDEPQLFAPVLKIKPIDPVPSESPTAPKIVIKNIPKDPPKAVEQDPVPQLGFQPLRQGPARTKGGPAAAAAAAAGPAKVEKRSKRFSSDGAAPSPQPPPAAGPSSAKKPREVVKKVKVKEARPRADSDAEAPVGIITETVGSYTDEAGNKVWICPACGKQDDGSPMIGCDQCDDW